MVLIKQLLTIKRFHLILIDVDKENLSSIANELNADYYVCDLANVEMIEETLNTQIQRNKMYY